MCAHECACYTNRVTLRPVRVDYTPHCSSRIFELLYIEICIGECQYYAIIDIYAVTRMNVASFMQSFLFPIPPPPLLYRETWGRKHLQIDRRWAFHGWYFNGMLMGRWVWCTKFVEKIFVRSSQTVNFMEAFSLESFLPCGSLYTRL